jgi:hypothetical protein
MNPRRPRVSDAELEQILECPDFRNHEGTLESGCRYCDYKAVALALQEERIYTTELERERDKLKAEHETLQKRVSKLESVLHLKELKLRALSACDPE